MKRKNETKRTFRLLGTGGGGPWPDIDIEFRGDNVEFLLEGVLLALFMNGIGMSISLEIA
jgi:hypothetical protein